MSTDPRYPPWPEKEIKLDGGSWRLDPFTRIVRWVPEPKPVVAVARGRVLKPCGTPAAYRRHMFRREAPCPECVAAAREDKRQSRTRAAQRRAA